MIQRPKLTFIRQFNKEPLPDKLLARFKRIYRKGGLTEYEPEHAVKMADVSLKQPGSTDALGGDFLRWIYVGDLWWCRKRMPRNGRVSYEFARCVARRPNRDGTGLEIEGLWDCRRHALRPEAEIVFKKLDGKPDERSKGYIVGYNEFEVLVSWEDRETLKRGVAVPVRDFGDLVFKYVEDSEKFARIFAKLKRS